MKNTGDGRRVARVEREVQQVIAKFLLSGFKLPLPGLVTISKVIMPADLRAAKVYVSVLGAEGEQAQAVKILNERAFEVQKFIGHELKMRYCPKLTFYVDDMTEKVLKIDKIFQEIEQNRTQNTNLSSDLQSDEVNAIIKSESEDNS